MSDEVEAMCCKETPEDKLGVYYIALIHNRNSTANAEP